MKFRLFAALVFSLGMFSPFLKAATPTVEAPEGTKSVEKIKEMQTAPNAGSKEVKPKSSTGKIEITDVNFGAKKETRKNPSRLKTSPGDSVLVITGYVNMTDKNYITVRPLFPLASSVFSDAPTTCSIENSFFPQTQNGKEDVNYKYYFIFKETAKKPECWNYFSGLKNITIDFWQGHVKVVSPSEEGEHLTLDDAGPRNLSAGALGPKDPKGD